jgi:hypothetical protein
VTLNRDYNLDWKLTLQQRPVKGLAWTHAVWPFRRQGERERKRKHRREREREKETGGDLRH